MLDLDGASILQVAALRRMTSDPALAERCDAWLAERGAHRPRHALARRFAGLAAHGLLFVWMEFDERVEADLPSRRLLLWTGGIVLALIVGFFAAIIFLLAQVRSWPWRIGILAAISIVGAIETYRIDRRLRR